MTDSENTSTAELNIPDDLDTFKDMLFKGKEPEKVAESKSEDDDTLAPEDQTNEAETATNEQEASPEKPVAEKPKKQSAQERIDELTAARRAAERELAAARAEIERLKTSTQNTEPAKTQEPPKAEEPAKADEAPDPLDEEKYPLGEMDPQFIRDLTRYEFNLLVAQQKAAEAEAAEKAKAQEATSTIVEDWNNRLAEARDTKYPDFEEKAAVLNTEMADLDPVYGDYLATTIMTMENGVDVLYHLANNIDEAKAIASTNAVAATLALGRLSARLAGNVTETKPKIKTSQAPEPPPLLNKGSSTVDIVRADTDDLEKFKDLLWPNRKRN